MHKLLKLRFMAVLVAFALMLTPALASADQGDQTVAEMAGGGQLAGLGMVGLIALGTVTCIGVGGVVFAFANQQTKGSTKDTPIAH